MSESKSSCKDFAQFQKQKGPGVFEGNRAKLDLSYGGKRAV